ncbi:hypothetical protein PAXRUDRAFT_130618 [Paxillus rubicundulus Ve08.2h10]|uniref:Uncharacterized protein n=1 Tax=Paxillus rubicundulus Ve08.2h10 TaxID=930991 RepID=A0A0D0ECW8_9AGAM|nr:hypothetical protein PAXRUDRAFT_130618 [Paxillus rubicundulus Ve08.2h10]
MCPNTSKADLPSTHNISTYVHNSFIEFLNTLKARIQATTAGCISTITDLWSVDQTKATFMGLTAHWIEKNIKSGAWTMCSEVIASKGISGAHSWQNLGHYFVGHVSMLVPCMTSLLR